MSKKPMTGYEYERACAEYLRKKGFKRVRVTKASRDQGVDILCKKHRKTYAVQCKYYATPVGNKAVQEVYAGADFYGCDRAMVISNNSFTKGAYELADTLEVELVPGVEPKRRFFGIAELLAFFVILLGVGCYLAVENGLFDLTERFPPVSETWFYGALAAVTALLLYIGHLRRKRRFRFDEEAGEVVSD